MGHHIVVEIIHSRFRVHHFSLIKLCQQYLTILGLLRLFYVHIIAYLSHANTGTYNYTVDIT